jgi:hypothetical protein
MKEIEYTILYYVCDYFFDSINYGSGSATAKSCGSGSGTLMFGIHTTVHSWLVENFSSHCSSGLRTIPVPSVVIGRPSSFSPTPKRRSRRCDSTTCAPIPSATIGGPNELNRREYCTLYILAIHSHHPFTP